MEQVLAGDLIIAASPTYKATYSGLVKAFFDRFAGGSLAGRAAVPLLLGGAPNHELAVNVHFLPLLLELGARIPAGGLFVLESAVGDFPAFAAGWAAANRPLFAAGTPRGTELAAADPGAGTGRTKTYNLSK